MTGAFSTIVLWSLLFGNVCLSLVFFYFFAVTRLFSGGYHAKTYTQCFLVTNGTFVISVLLAMIIENNPALCVLLAVVSQISIFALSPVQNINHPLSERRLLITKRIGMILAIGNISILSLLYFIHVQGLLFGMTASSLLAVLLLIVFSQKKKRGGHHK